MKKNKAALILMLTAMLGISAYSAEPAKPEPHRIYVSLNGSDENSGEEGNPFKTLERAQEAVREKTAAGLTQDVEVIIGGGTYELPEILVFDETDGGTDEFSVTWKGAQGEYPTLSGGRRVGGFIEQENGVWVADAPQFDTVREITVNDMRSYRAASDREIYPISYYDDPTTPYTRDGYYFDKRALPLSEHNGDIEVHFALSWRTHIQQMVDLYQDPENEGRVILVGRQPYFQQSIHQNDEASFFLCRPGTRCRVENVFAYLDEPGEFYFNTKTKKLYYIPRENEDMNTAEVYVSVLEQVVRVAGRGENRVNNLHFEGLKFAHTKFTWVEKMGGYSNQQANENVAANSWDTHEDRAALDISAAKNMSIRNCVFLNTAETGVRFWHTVSDSVIDGCAIYDTGGSGIVVGSSKFLDENPSRVDMYYHAEWDCSDMGIYGDAPIYMNRSLQGANTWADKAQGEKSWYKLAFDRPVSVDEIRYDYYPMAENDSDYKHNIELLLANEEDFSDAVVIYKNDDKPVLGSGITIVPKDTTTKYKYFMARKTEVGDFGIANLHIWTDDYDLQKREVVRNISVTNNVLKRLGNVLHGAPGITAYYYYGLKISHNELDQTSYSAISSGWGWSQDRNQHLEDLEISHNKISNYLMTNSDGGGIYTLSWHRGAQIKYNYVAECRGNYAAIYNDNGSGGFEIEGNVTETGGNVYFFHAGDINGNTVKETYATHNKYRNVGDNDVEPFINYIKGNPPARALEIMNAAGPLPGYEYLDELVPEGEAYYMFETETDIAGFLDLKTDNPVGDTDMMLWLRDEAKTALSLAVCGDLPGQYSGAEYLNLQNCYDDVLAGTYANGNEHQTALIRIRNALTNLQDSLIKADIPALIETAETLIAENPHADAKKLKAIIKEAEAAEEEDYGLIKRFEAALSEFEATLGRTDIHGFKISGNDSAVIIDHDKKLITVPVDATADLSAVNAYIKVSQGAVSYPDCSSPVDLSNPLHIVVQNGDDMTEWRVVAQKMSSHDLGSTGYWVNINNKRAALTEEGDIRLEQCNRPYMFAGEQTNSVNLTFTSDKLDDYYGTRIIFLADKSGIAYKGTGEDDCFFELAVKKNHMELYRVEKNVRTIVHGYSGEESRLVDEIVQRDGSNSANIRIDSSVEGDMVRIKVYENNEMKMHVLCKAGNPAEKGYYGILSEIADVTVEVE